MSIHIDFRNKKLKRLRLSISPKAKFHEIFSLFDEIAFVPSVFPRDNVIYAILELVNNSLRAHRENDTCEPISIHIVSHGSSLQIDIQDRGGGFDPKRLPYDISTSVEDIDLNSKTFLDYRRQHGDSRFGMGLVIAKRTFSEFHLSFIEENGEERPWGEAGIVGTRIRLILSAEGALP